MVPRFILCQYRGRDYRQDDRRARRHAPRRRAGRLFQRLHKARLRRRPARDSLAARQPDAQETLSREVGIRKPAGLSGLLFCP